MIIWNYTKENAFPSEINSPNCVDRSPDRFWCQISFHVGLLLSDLEFQLSNPILLSYLSSRISPSSWQPDFVCQQKKLDLEIFLAFFVHRMYKTEKSLLIIQKASIGNYRCNAIKYSCLEIFLDTILQSRSLCRMETFKF